jgi:hypothetical protein
MILPSEMNISTQTTSVIGSEDSDAEFEAVIDELLVDVALEAVTDGPFEEEMYSQLVDLGGIGG